MTDITILEALQSFLQENVTSQIKLKQLNSTNTSDYKLVNPQVDIGWIPFGGALPEGRQADIPCIITGLRYGSDDGEEAEVNIKLLFAVYNPGFQNEGKTITNSDGYKDLLNLMELTKHELRKKRIIGGKAAVNYPFRWGVYRRSEPCPYWYGWLTFSVRENSGQYIPEISEQYL